MSCLWDFFDIAAVKYRYKLFAADLTWRTSEEDVLSALTMIQVDSKDVQGVTIFEDPSNGLSLGFCCIGLSSWRSQNLAMRNLPNVTIKDWCPTVFPFSKRQFYKLISEAKSSGRMRVIQEDGEETEENDFVIEKQEVPEIRNDLEPEQPQRFYHQYVHSPTPYHYHRFQPSPYVPSWPASRYDSYRYRRPRCRRPSFYRGSFYYQYRTWERFRTDIPPPNYYAESAATPVTEGFQQHHLHHHQSQIHQGSVAPNCAERQDDILDWNRAVSSSAISHAVMYAVSGQHQKSMEVLKASIDIVEKSSAFAEDKRSHVLVQSMKDTLQAIGPDDQKKADPMSIVSIKSEKLEETKGQSVDSEHFKQAQQTKVDHDPIKKRHPADAGKGELKKHAPRKSDGKPKRSTSSPSSKKKRARSGSSSSVSTERTQKENRPAGSGKVAETAKRESVDRKPHSSAKTSQVKRRGKK